MKKKVILIVGIVVLVALVVGAVLILNNKGENDGQQIEESLIKYDTTEDMETIINKIYEKSNLELASLTTNVLDINDVDSVTAFTGLKSNSNVEALVVSEPMMSSQAYSLVLVKAKDGADVESMKQEMLDNVNTNKWICVSAEKLYITNYNNLICLVMSSEEWASPVYNEFKNLVNGKVGKELVKSEEITEEPLPEDVTEDTKPEEDKKPVEQKPEEDKIPVVEESLIKYETTSDISSIIDTVNNNANLGLRSLATNILDVSSSDTVTAFTGLKSNSNVEALVVSEPMMTSQAYSFVLVKAKDGANIENMKQEMLNNIDTNKWICVSAEKVYITNYENLICLVMSSEEWAKPVYNQFKNLVNGKVGKELSK